MFPFTRENISTLTSHNINISELKTTSVMSNQPRKMIHLPKVRMLSRGGRMASNIRITNVRGIRPPNPGGNKPDEDIRAQKEVPERSRLCAYTNYECWAPVVSGRRFCARHLLSDPGAPVQPCSHRLPGGEICGAPAPKERSPGLCFEHGRAALLARQKSTAPPPPVISTETLLTQLQHYVRVERPRTTSCASSVSVVSDPEPEISDAQPVDPFKQIDSSAINASYSTSLLDCGSASESDEDNITLGPDSTCRYMSMDTTVGEVPTEERPLWRAGVFTAEEAISEMRQSLECLQRAYVRQGQRCFALLQLARKDYLKALKLEKEQYCSINSQARSGPLNIKERRQLRKLKAFASYHRKHGVDALLARKLLHKRAKWCGTSSREKPLSSAVRCTFSEGGVRCSAPAAPAAKHCFRHILLDTQQVLFAACGDSRGMSSCGEPVAKLPLPSRACRYHTDPPQYTVFTLKKDESGSESETDTGTDVSVANEQEAREQTS